MMKKIKMSKNNRLGLVFLLASFVFVIWELRFLLFSRKIENFERLYKSYSKKDGKDVINYGVFSTPLDLEGNKKYARPDYFFNKHKDILKILKDLVKSNSYDLSLPIKYYPDKQKFLKYIFDIPNNLADFSNYYALNIAQLFPLDYYDNGNKKELKNIVDFSFDIVENGQFENDVPEVLQRIYKNYKQVFFVDDYNLILFGRFLYDVYDGGKPSFEISVIYEYDFKFLYNQAKERLLFYSKKYTQNYIVNLLPDNVADLSTLVNSDVIIPRFPDGVQERENIIRPYNHNKTDKEFKTELYRYASSKF